MAVRIEGRVGKRRVVLLVWALWWSVCALSLLLIAVTIAFHLITRYDWYFNGSFQPWRMLTVEALGALGAPILGGLIVWRQPANRYGWIWCVFGLGLAVRGAAYAYEIWAWYVAPFQRGGFEAAWLATVMYTLTSRVGPAAAGPVPRRAAAVAALATGGLGNRGCWCGVDAVGGGRARTDGGRHTQPDPLAVWHARRGG